MEHHRRAGATPRWLSLAGLLLALWGPPALASGRPSSAADSPEGHPHVIFGPKVTVVELCDDRGHPHETMVGPGFFFAALLEHGELEVEASVKTMFADHEIAVPVELVVKKLFHPAPWVHPFIGAGGSLVIADVNEPGKDGAAPDHQLLVVGGLATVAGIDFWLTHEVGLALEADFNVLGGHGLLFELGGSVSLLYGF